MFWIYVRCLRVCSISDVSDKVYFMLMCDQVVDVCLRWIYSGCVCVSGVA